MKKILLIIVISIFLTVSVWADSNPVTQTQVSVTVTSSAGDIITENQAGQDIFIQNNDATGIVYLNFLGDATVSATMLTLDPGDTISITNTTNSVNAIGSIGSNANVVVILGR